MNADIHTLTGAYALDALSETERGVFEHHLAECPSCAAEVAELQDTAVRLGMAVAVTPPPSMKAQVLAAARRVRQLPPGDRAADQPGTAATSGPFAPPAGAADATGSPDHRGSVGAGSPGQPDQPSASGWSGSAGSAGWSGSPGTSGWSGSAGARGPAGWSASTPSGGSDGAADAGAASGPAAAGGSFAERLARRRWSTWTAGLAAAACLVVAVVFGVQFSSAQEEAQQAQQQLDLVMSVLSAPDAKIATAAAGDSRATAVVSQSQGKVAVMARGMPPLPEDRSYQVWSIGPTGMHSVGVMSTGTDPAPVLGDLADGDRIGVTIEPRGGSATPSADPIMEFPLPT